MNSGSYATDSKFLSAAASDDYHSQASAASAMASSGYMNHGDYYAAQHAAAAAHYGQAYGPTGSMGQLNQHALASGYGRGSTASIDMYGGYYQQCNPHQMIQQQMMQAASGGHLSPLNHTGTSHLSGSTVARSPVASPQPPHNNVGLNHPGHDGNGNSLCGPSAGGPGGQGGGGNSGGSNGGNDEGYPSPQHPGIVSGPQLTPGGGQGGQDGMSSDCSDDESSPSSNRQMPVVYPWMKKIHVGGAGKTTILIIFIMDPASFRSGNFFHRVISRGILHFFPFFWKSPENLSFF